MLLEGRKEGRGYTSKVFSMADDIDEDALLSAMHLNLNSEPFSVEAIGLTQQLVDQVRTDASGKLRPRSKKLIAAVGALVADLLKAARSDPLRYSYRSMASASFSDHWLGYQSFKRAVDGLARGKLLDIVPGVGGGNVPGRATRVRATPKLLKLAKDNGVSAADWSIHFRPLPRPAVLAEPLVLRASSKMVRGEKQRGATIPIDYSAPQAASLAKQVNELNSFFAGIAIEPGDCHYAFRRVFNEGDDPSFDWDKGGRLISVGESYQQMPQAERNAIKLNGEPTVEIDIKASHLTILHALLGEPFDPEGADPYEIPGIPRLVVKGWVTMTLGYDKFQTRWSNENKRKYREKVGGDLQKDYPIKEVREKVLNHLPVLWNWPSCSIRWGDLQYLESCAIIDTVHELALRHGIPALPVYDSIIVPQSAKKKATEVLIDKFKQHIGVRPALSVK